MTRTKAEQILFDKKLEPFYDIDGNKYYCKKCHQNIRSKREAHYNICVGIGIQAKIKNLAIQSFNDSSIKIHSELCDLGCGQQSMFFHKNGKAYCSEFGNKCPIKVEKDSEAKKGINPFERTGYKHTEETKALMGWSKGLTKETSPVLRKIGDAVKLNYKLYGHERSKLQHTEETKETIRQKINARYASGWQATSCGRAKSYPYENPSEGLVHLTGTWEVDFAKALDQAGIKWFRNKKRFDYIKPDGKDATYLPDFYIPQYNVYIETKGYETDLDRSKWEQFHEPLIVLRKIEIFQIKKWLKDNVEINEGMMIELCKFPQQSKNANA